MNFFPGQEQPGCPKRWRFEVRTEVGSKGEFHEIVQSASEVLLTGVALRREIHLEQQCASEGIVEGVRLQGGYKVVPPRRVMCPRMPSDGGQPER